MSDEKIEKTKFIVIIRPDFMDFCHDACRAAVFNHLLFRIAGKSKDQPKKEIQAGNVLWYAKTEQIVDELSHAWGSCKVRKEVNAIIGMGLIGRKPDPNWGVNRTKHFCFGTKQCRKFLAFCHELHFCIVHMDLPLEVRHLIYSSNANDTSIKCICSKDQMQAIDSSDASDTSIGAITKEGLTKKDPKDSHKEKLQQKEKPATPPSSDLPDATTSAASGVENLAETTGTPPLPPAWFPIATPPTLPEPPSAPALETESNQAIGNQAGGVVAALVPPPAREPWQECCEFYNHKRKAPFNDEQQDKQQKQEVYAKKLVALFTLEQIEKLAGKMDTRDTFWKNRGGCETWDTFKHYTEYMADAGVSLYAPEEPPPAWRPPSRPADSGRRFDVGVSPSPRVTDTSTAPPPSADVQFAEQQRLAKLQGEIVWVQDHLDSIARGFQFKPTTLAIIHKRRLALVAAGLSEFVMEGDEQEQPYLPDAAKIVESGGLHMVRA